MPEPADSSPYSLTEDILRERLRHPTYGHKLPQIFAGFLAYLSGISFGTCLGWSQAVSPEVTSTTDFDQDQVSWLISIIVLGCSCGVTLSSFMLQQMGPKRAQQFMGLFYIITWWLILIPSMDIQLAGRFFLGFFGVCYLTASEQLLNQTVDYRIRKYINIFNSMSVLQGLLIARIVATVSTTFYLTMVSALIPMLQFLCLLLVPESPVALYATSHAEAAKSLEWYRGKGNFYADMANIKKEWDHNRQDGDVYKYMLFSRVVYRPLLTIIGLTFFRASSGYYVFMFFNINVISCVKNVYDPVVDATIVAIAFILSKLLWSLLHITRQWKMRRFLIFSCFLSALALLLFTIYLFLVHYSFQYAQQTHYPPVGLVCLFLLFYDMGLGYFQKILILEYMPIQFYKTAQMIGDTMFWLFVFGNIHFYAKLYNGSESYIFFSVYTVILIIGGFFCYFFIVETRDKSLIQIQLAFGGNPIGRRGNLFRQLRETL